ncbi:MAG: GDP-mannose 4,6-dehydratase [Bdellovibrionia bacterium]
MSSLKTAIVIGHNGQDGRFLTPLLQSQNYRVLGIDVHSSERWGTFPELEGDPAISIQGTSQVSNLINRIKPDEIYYLATFHHSSQDKLEDNLNTFNQFYQVNVHSPLNFLESIRLHSPRTKLFYAGSSHIFGNPKESPQTEETPFNPGSEYGITKAAGIHCCRMYRKKYGIFAACGILYNHESSFRKENFLSKKLIKAALNIFQKKQQEVVVGNLNAQTDWGYAPDFVQAMHQILSLDQPDDFIISSGLLHTVKDFASISFELLGLDWKKHVREDRQIIQRQESVEKPLLGDPSKIKSITGWIPYTSFREMIIKLLKDEAELQGISILK